MKCNKKCFKVYVSLLLIAAIMAGITACGGNKGNENIREQTQTKTTEATAKSVKVSESKVTMKVMLPESISPANKEHLFFTGMEEMTNVKLDPIFVPLENYKERMNVTLASADLPDLISMYSVTDFVNLYGPQGAFVNLDLEKMPSYKMRLGKVVKAEDLIKAPDGKIYGAYGFDEMGVQNNAIFARTDLMKKAGIAIPKASYSMDEFYNILLKLKKTYPTSYPLLQFAPAQHWESLAIFFQTRANIYYDPFLKKMLDGRLTKNYKDMLGLLSNAYKDGVLHPEFATITRTQFDEYIVTGKSLVNIGSAAVGDVHTANGRKREPDYVLEAIEPPQYNGRNFWQESVPPLMISQAYVISDKSKLKDTAVKLLDWLYSEEGSIFAQWGKEGVTYEMKDGKMKLLENISTRKKELEGKTGLKSLWNDFDIGRHGWYLHRREDRHIEMDRGPLTIAGAELYKKYEVSPAPIVNLNVKEQEEVRKLLTPINTYLNEQQLKIILGELPLNEWDNVMKKAIEMGNDKAVSIYQGAYERVYGK